MRYLLVTLTILLSVPAHAFGAACSATISQGSTESCDSITQNTITWTFDTDYTVGQFVNGEYWVVDPGSGVTITDITPNSVSATRTVNGSMINPTDSSTQGFDEGMLYDTYSDAANDGLDVISGGSDLVITSGDSLVSSRSNTTAGARPQMTDTAILTCLSSTASSGDFRPYYGTTKTTYNTSSINYSALGSLDCQTGSESLAIWQTRMHKVWYEARAYYMGQYYRASNHMTGMGSVAYGSDMASWSGQAVLRLQCNDSNEDKYDLLISMLQYAIDISGAAADGMDWGGDGGHPHGRKSVLALGAAVLGSTTMQVQLDPANGVIFGEDNLITEITTDWYSTTMCAWDGNYCGLAACQYNAVDHPVGTAEWKKHPGYALEYNCAAFGSDTAGQTYLEYRDSYGSDIAGMLASLVMGQESNWNRALSFDYAERFRTEIMAAGYTYIGSYGDYTPNAWTTAMYDAYWDTYRGYTPATYTGHFGEGSATINSGTATFMQ